MSDIAAFLEDTARQAGALLLRYFRAEGVETRLKDDRTVVTEADLEADRLITAAIQDAFPGEALVSEESRHALPPGEEGPVWVVDPLDGTSNFSLGMPVWGVSIARVVNGFPASAAAYFPLLGEYYAAEVEQGARLNGAPIHARLPQEGQPASFFVCCGRTHRRYDLSVRYKPRIFGSAVYDYCAVARGAAVLGFESMPKIWDIAAGWLIVHEAGGLVQAHSGPEPFPLSPDADYGKLYFPTLAAPDAATLELGRQGIKMRG
ncbi:MAG: hypothetical protein L0Z70_01850 [Chloroflexi bacterium]|nr:hypothetical protein [Chloroflexota bacterium]